MRWPPGNAADVTAIGVVALGGCHCAHILRHSAMCRMTHLGDAVDEIVWTGIVVGKVESLPVVIGKGLRVTQGWRSPTGVMR